MREYWLDPPEPKIVGKCKHCGDLIGKGEEIVEYDGDMYHPECFDECASQIMFDLFCLRVTLAGENDDR